MKRKHPLGQRYNVVRPFKGRDVLFVFTTVGGHDFFITPRQLIEALDDASQEMGHSNYHNDKFERIREIIRRYCEEHNIPLGLSRKQRETIETRQHEAFMRAIEKCKKMKNPLARMAKLLDKYENRNGRNIK